MEARPTRKTLRAFPPDLGFTQDPKDALRQFLDLPGRQAVLASEYMKDQMANVFLETADPNDPDHHFSSGMVIPLDATLTGNFVKNLQDLVTMEVTGFDHIDTLTVSGLAPTEYLGISYAQEPDGSGVLFLTCSGVPYVFRYEWSDRNTIVSSGIAGLTEQNFAVAEEDEYLVIQHGTAYGTIAELKHTPRAKPVLIDTKNLEAPWAPETSDGIVADPDEITVSGNTLILTDPRPSYLPPTPSGDQYIYPVGYQPDQNWASSFIAEYEYDTKDYPYGLSQSTLRHNLGLFGAPLVGADDL